MNESAREAGIYPLEMGDHDDHGWIWIDNEMVEAGPLRLAGRHDASRSDASVSCDYDCRFNRRLWTREPSVAASLSAAA